MSVPACRKASQVARHKRLCFRFRQVARANVSLAVLPTKGLSLILSCLIFIFNWCLRTCFVLCLKYGTINSDSRCVIQRTRVAVGVLDSAKCSSHSIHDPGLIHSVESERLTLAAKSSEMV